MKKILVMLAMSAMASMALATVSVNLELAYLNDANDVAISEGIKFLAFIDTDGDGINGLNLGNYSDDNALWSAAATANQGTFLWDANDVIIYNGVNAGAGVDGYFSLINTPQAGNSVVTLGVDGIGVGNQVYVMWFAELAGSTSAPGIIHQVGYYTDSNWTLPTDGNVLQAEDYALNQSAITVQAIPEPATALLVAIGGGMAYVLRRKQNILA
ncbi:MAG: PEP-CTERM sorting domain-containing protein [Kiritimatiellales bacterium]